MNSTRNVARLAGLLYVGFSIPGFFGLMYVPSAIVVSGDPAATLHNVATFEALFRSGIVANLVGQAGFMFVAFVLYRLFKGVNQALAALMVILTVVSVPIVFVNELNHVALLTLASAAGPALAIGKTQTEGLVTLYLAQYRNGIFIAEIFWGLWLFPFGLLVIKSGFLPKTLGVLVIVAGVGWMVQSCSSLLSPAIGHGLSQLTSVMTAGELPMMLWLLIMGAKDREIEANILVNRH